MCIFHDESYLQYKNNNHKEHEQKVRDRLKAKVRNSIDQDEPLFCIGYHLPDIIFKRANFTKPVYFSGCKFQGLADFSSATFSAKADFYSATFYAEADFSSATFSAKADFSSATFKEADFNSATFSELANFYLATFKEADFYSATFKEVYFNSATFSELANFSSATFKEADFTSAKFQGVTDFNKAAFFDRTYFADSQDLGTFNGEMRFNYTLFEAKEKIIFEVQDLSNVSFMNSDITRIRFSDKARWGERKKEKR